jgi:hypothetical protein
LRYQRSDGALRAVAETLDAAAQLEHEWTLADDGALAIFAGDLLIGSLDYNATFGSAAGVAMQVDPASYADAADTANWCAATSNYDGGRLGTPRAENFSCG